MWMLSAIINYHYLCTTYMCLYLTWWNYVWYLISYVTLRLYEIKITTRCFKTIWHQVSYQGFGRVSQHENILLSTKIVKKSLFSRFAPDIIVWQAKQQLNCLMPVKYLWIFIHCNVRLRLFMKQVSVGTNNY